MASKAPVMLLDLSDLPTKRQLMQKISTLSGLYEVTLKPRKLTRTLSQNSYWWVAVVTPFCEWLRENWGDNSIELEQAHEVLKQQILGTKDLVNKESGEVIQITRSSRVLDTAEFGELIEKSAAWLAEFAGIVILPPELYQENTPARPSLKNQLEDSLKEVQKRKAS